MPSTRARLDEQDRPTTFVDSAQIELTLSASDLALGGRREVGVYNGAPGGGASQRIAIYIGHPPPVISRTDPSLFMGGSGDVVLTVVGSGFRGGETRTLLDDLELQTTVHAPDSLSAVIPEAALEARRSAVLHVLNPPPGETRAVGILDVFGHPPRLDSVRPDSVPVGRAVDLVVSGAHLDMAVDLMVDGILLPVERKTLFADTLMYFTLSSSVLQSTGPLTLSLAAFSGVTPPETVEIVAVPPPAEIQGLSPSMVYVGALVSVTVSGVGFDPVSSVLWDGVPRVTTFVDSTTLTFDVDPVDVAATGSGEIVVTKPGTISSAPWGLPVVPTGPTISSLTELAIWTSDLAADTVRDLVYAVVPQGAPTYENQIVALDPVTAAVVWSAPTRSDPRVVKVTDDASFAYVGFGGSSSVLRIDLSARREALEIPLPYTNDGPTFAVDIVPVPGAARTIAVALRERITTTPSEGVVVFDDDVMRPVRSGNVNRIEPSSSPVLLYGYNGESTALVHELHLGSSGVEQGEGKGGLVGGFRTDFTFRDGALLATSGRWIDAASLTLVRDFGIAGVALPEPLGGRAYFAGDYSPADALVVMSSIDGVELGRVEIPSGSEVRALVRFGPDGMVIGREQSIVFLRSDLIGS